MPKPLTTQERYARCNGVHRYTGETVFRGFQGHTLELRVCSRCRVPESPKLHTASVGGRPRELHSFHERDG